MIAVEPWREGKHSPKRKQVEAAFVRVVQDHSCHHLGKVLRISVL